MHPLITALIETVKHQDESISQALAWNDPETTPGFDDPTKEATPAFHLHHTVLVFRYHARHAIKAIEPDTTEEQLDGLIPHHENVPIPRAEFGPAWSPAAAARDLEQSLDEFAGFLLTLPYSAYETQIGHNRPFTLATFLNMMTRHITWHAAAIHYRSRPAPTNAR